MEISTAVADALTKDDPMFRKGAEAMYRTLRDLAVNRRINYRPEYAQQAAHDAEVIEDAARTARSRVLGR